MYTLQIMLKADMFPLKTTRTMKNCNIRKKKKALS